MRAGAIALLGTLALLMAIALWQGTDTFAQAVRASVKQLIGFLPILVIAMAVAGFTETLLPRGFVETWLSDASGWRGIGVAWLAGILTPGGSLVGLPMVAVMWQAGAGLSVLMTYATSFALLSMIRIPLEVGFYGWRLTAIRVAVSLALPILAGLLTRLFVPLVEKS